MARRERKAAENGPDRQPAKSAGIRMNPRKHAGTAANRREKAPTENSWGFNSGGGGRNRTAVRKPSTGRSTYLVWPFDLTAPARADALEDSESLSFSAGYRDSGRHEPVRDDSATGPRLAPRSSPAPQAERVQSLAGVRRPERNGRRWRLLRFQRIYEVTGPRYALRCFATHVETRSPPIVPKMDPRPLDFKAENRSVAEAALNRGTDLALW